MIRAVLPACVLLAGCAAAGVPAEEPLPPGVPDFPAALRTWEAVDLTHPIDGDVPYWPGSKYFPFEAWDLARWEEVRAFSRAYRVPEHYGTHVDAPVHFAEGQATMEAVPVTAFFGPLVVLDIRGRAARDPDCVATAEDVADFERIHGRVPAGAIALLRTGWEARWGDMAAYRNFGEDGRLHFPSWGPEAARILLLERGCRGLGVDVLSVDRGIDNEFPVHRIGCGNGRWFVENVMNLGRLPATGAVIFVLPIPLRGGSGAQARVVAFLPPAGR